MNTIKIYYRPFPFIRYQKQLTVKCPDSFSELTPKQLIAIANLLRGLITEPQFLCILTGIPKRVMRLLTPFDKFKLSELTQPFFESTPYHQFILKYIANGYLLCPKTKLKYVTFSQFIFADSYFSSYTQSNNPDDLYKFIASLYLPKGTAFEEKLIEENFHFAKKTDATTLQAIAINYQLIREWLTLAYPLIFSRQEDKPSKVDQAGSTNWVKVFDALVGDDIVNHDKYADMPLHNVFRYMTSRIKENIKRKKHSG